MYYIMSQFSINKQIVRHGYKKQMKISQKKKNSQTITVSIIIKIFKNKNSSNL